MKRYLLFVLSLGLAVSLLVAACGDDDDDGNGAAETPSDEDIVAAVSVALHEKHDLDDGTLDVSLGSVLDDRYASGGARDEFSGGMWFAALVDGEWRIVWDGNGVIDCASVDPYPDFPASMIPNCLDADGELTQR